MAAKHKITRFFAALMLLAAGAASAHPGHGESGAHLHPYEIGAAIVALSLLVWAVKRTVKQKALAKSSSRID